MRKMHPGKIIQVPFFAGNQKAGRHHVGRLFAFVAVFMPVAGSVRPVGLFLEGKQAGFERGQQTAHRANHPAGEGGYRYADVCHAVERVYRKAAVGRNRGRQQFFDGGQRVAHGR